jgi:hypothetical protein
MNRSVSRNGSSPAVTIMALNAGNQALCIVAHRFSRELVIDTPIVQRHAPHPRQRIE